MSDAVLSLLLPVAFLLLTAAVRFFKTLERNGWSAMRNALLAGGLAGVALAVVPPHPVSIALALTAAVWYTRLTGQETEPVDGMLSGAVSGAAAAIPLALIADDGLSFVSVCILVGACAGYGATFAALHVGDTFRRPILDAATFAAAAGVAFVPEWIESRGTDPESLALAVVAGVPMVALAALFGQWRHVREELHDEASLGFIDPGDVRTTAHPLLRLGRGGWHDPAAHREFVRLANRIALSKRQQRRRRGELARLYQLEIIKLRTQLQQMSEINRATGRAFHPSDTMPGHEAEGWGMRHD